MWDYILDKTANYGNMPRETAKQVLVFLAVALFVIAVLFSCGNAQAQSVCRSTQYVADLAQKMEGYQSHRLLTPASAQVAVAIYNATPPVGDEQFDTVLLIEGQSGYGAILFFGNGGVLCNNLRMDDSGWREAKPLLKLDRDA